MLFAGVTLYLAKEFGFDFYGSFVINDFLRGIIDLDKTTVTLNNNLITKGRSLGEEMNRVRFFIRLSFKLKISVF